MAQARTFFLFLGLAAAGCSTAHPPPDPDEDRCRATKACFAVDAIGCCAETSATVSICASCPPGTAEYRGCRTTGCDDPCQANDPDGAGARPAEAPEPAPMAPTCFADLGGGCCGEGVERNACTGECPAGSLDQTRCAARASDAADPIAPPDAGGPGLVPAVRCLESFGGGCCGAQVQRNACGGCPTGSVEEFACTDYTGDANLVPPRGDAGSGEGIPPPGDGGGAPERPYLHDAGVADPPADGGGAQLSDSGAPPPVDCMEDLGNGCCGGPVTVNACTGSCRDGSRPRWECTGFSPSCP